MALPASGQLSARQINDEAIHPLTLQVSLNDRSTRDMRYPWRARGGLGYFTYPLPSGFMNGEQISFADLRGAEYYGGFSGAFYELYTSSVNGWQPRDPNVGYVHIYLAGAGGGGGCATASTGPWVRGTAAAGGGGGGGMSYYGAPGSYMNFLGPFNIIIGAGGSGRYVGGDSYEVGGPGTQSYFNNVARGTFIGSGGGGGGGASFKWTPRNDQSFAQGGGGADGNLAYGGNGGGADTGVAPTYRMSSGGGGSIRFNTTDAANGGAGGPNTAGAGGAATNFTQPFAMSSWLDSRGITRVISPAFNAGSGGIPTGVNGGRGGGGGGGCGTKRGALSGNGGGGFALIIYTPESTPR
jgi:hypothetical protein